jgi:DNA modification methylase
MIENRIDAYMQWLQVHPAAEKVYKTKNLEGLKLAMHLGGQLEPITVIRRKQVFLIIDGISRYLVAKELQWKSLRGDVIRVPEKKINDHIVLKNFKTKRSILELCDHAEVILGILGKSQGKRREIIGDLSQGDKDFGLAGRDRFKLSCEIMGLDFSASTLRRLLAVREFEKNEKNAAERLGLMDKLEKGEITINQAYEKVKRYKDDKLEQNTNSLKEALIYAAGNHFKLYNKTCEDLRDIPDNSIDVGVESSPYFRQRNFPDGTKPEGVIPHGQEPSVDEYVKKQVSVFKGVYPKLKDTGSLFIVMADSHQGTHCLVTPKFIIAMVDAGWYLIDEWIWKKKNPKPQTVKKRLLPAYEKILHFVKDPEKYYFREFKNWMPDQKFELVRGKKAASKKTSNWSFKRPLERFRNFLEEQHVAKIIETSVYNWAELKEIDPKYRHLAPFPEVLPLLPILMTTKPGDTVLDVYSGTGTSASVAVALGRNAIGFDTDTESHEFSIKRLTLVEKTLPSVQELSNLENEYIIPPNLLREGQSIGSNRVNS